MTAEELKTLLSTYNIQFREAGENVGRDNININCPFCAGADPSFHMGLSTVGKGYACWRDPAHRGRNLNRVFKVLGLPIVSTDYFFAPNALDDIAGGTFFNKTALTKPVVKFTELPQHFMSIVGLMETSPHRRYLWLRGFSDPEVVCVKYNLLFSREPKWADRVILPVYVNDEVSWTGRTILTYGKPRYLSAHGEEARNIKDCLFNYNELTKAEGEALVIVEGPFDALKLDYYGAALGVRATCLFGLTASETQLALLNNILGNFNSIYIALDQGEVAGAVKLMKQLPFCQILQLPVKDFGMMLGKDIKTYIRETLLN